MRYKLLLCALVLLIATPVAAQEFSHLIVETGKPTPSVVRTGESFKITYRVRFVGTVVISEENMQPDNIHLDNIEVVGLEVKKREPYPDDSLGIINVWDFTYTFRIIQPDKGVKKIPSFNFIWVEKKAGVTVEETKDKEKPREMPTDEVGVNYVSSIVKPPPLDIRDEISFVLPVASGTVLRRWAYGVIGVSFLLFAVVLTWFARLSKSRQVREVDREYETETAEADTVTENREPILSPRQARKKFLRELKELRCDSQLDFVKKVRPLIRTLLLAELPGVLRSSMSANDIYAKLNGLDDKQKKRIGFKYAIMLELAQRLKDYQEDVDLERGKFIPPFKEGGKLREMVSGLKLHKRTLSFVEGRR